MSGQDHSTGRAAPTQRGEGIHRALPRRAESSLLRLTTFWTSPVAIATPPKVVSPTHALHPPARFSFIRSLGAEGFHSACIGERLREAGTARKCSALSRHCNCNASGPECHEPQQGPVFSLAVLMLLLILLSLKKLLVNLIQIVRS